MQGKKAWALFVVAVAGCAVFGSAQQTAKETVVARHIVVTSTDLSAANEGKQLGFHVTPVAVEGGKVRAAALNAEGSRMAREEEARNQEATPDTVPVPAAPYFYPADLTKGTNATYNIRLGTTTQHAIYVDYSGTVASNWGNPEGFLKDVNSSTFIHLTDQYTGKTTNGRYPVGTNASVTYSYYGNTLYEHEIAAIVHSVASKSGYGAGTGHLYHIFLPMGTDTCFDQGSCYAPDNPANWAFCAYHDAWTFKDIGTVYYTVEPYQNVSGCAVQTPSPNGQLADSTNSVLSHELFETITDPNPGYAYENRTSLDLDGYEIGDECQPLVNSSYDFLTPTFLINGKKYEVQLEYSNTYHACAAVP